MQVKRSVLRLAQRAIVLQLLRDDHAEAWTQAELRREAPDLAPQALTDGLSVLEAECVAVVDSGMIRASRCARHLDSLGLVTV
jgi:hypothetical protein